MPRDAGPPNKRRRTADKHAPDQGTTTGTAQVSPWASMSRTDCGPRVLPTKHTSDKTATDIPSGTKTSCKLIHQCLRHLYKPFKKDIRAADVASYFYQEEIIDDDTLQWIQEEKRPRRRADILIKAIAGSKKKSFTVADITRCLGMSKYDHIAELLERTLSKHRDSTGEILEKRPVEGKYAKSRDLSEDTLYHLLPRLEKDVEPKDILDDLLSCGMLTFIDHEHIYTAPSVVDRWKTLLKCINGDVAYHFQLLYDVLSSTDVAFDCTLPSSSVDECGTGDTVNNGSSPVLRIDCHLPGISSFTEDRLKDVCIDLKLNGNRINVRKFETAIVNGSNKGPASRLQEFFSRELKTSNLHISLHCVRIRVQVISSESLRLLEDALTTKNGVPFVEKLLNELMTTEKIEQLRQGGTSEVKLEITASKQKQKERNLNISKTILQDNYEFLIEEIDGGDFIDMLQDVPESTDTINAIMSEQSRASRNRHLVEFLLNQGQTTLDRFLKEAVDQTLDYIVDLFETEPDQSLEYQASKRNLNISKTILQDNYDFLIEEIDGGDFIDMLQDVPESTDTINAIMSEQSRATRNRHLVEFLLSQCQTTLDRFLKEAVDQKLDYIVDLFETEPDQCLESQEEDDSTEDEYVRCPKRRRLSNSSEKTCLHKADFSIQYVEEGSEENDLQLYFKDLQDAREPESSSILHKTDSIVFESSKEKQEVHQSKGPYSIGESSPSTSLLSWTTSSPSTPMSELSVVRFKNNSISVPRSVPCLPDTQARHKWRQNDDIQTRATDVPSPPSFPRATLFREQQKIFFKRKYKSIYLKDQ